jgi:hypothetical protein
MSEDISNFSKPGSDIGTIYFRMKNGLISLLIIELSARKLEMQKIANGYRKRENVNTKYLLEETAFSAYSKNNEIIQIISEYNLFFENEFEFEFRFDRSKKLATVNYILYIFKHFHDEIKIIYFYLY